MRAIPVATDLLGELIAVGVAPKMTRVEQGDSWAEGPQKKDTQTGLPVWEVSVIVKEDGARPELEQVMVPSQTEPVLPFGPCRFEALTARPWLFNGRAGVSLSAANVSSLVQSQKRGEAA